MPFEVLSLVLPRQQNQSGAAHDGMAKSPEPPAVLYFKDTYAGNACATTASSWTISTAISFTHLSNSLWCVGTPGGARWKRIWKPSFP